MSEKRVDVVPDGRNLQNMFNSVPSQQMVLTILVPALMIIVAELLIFAGRVQLATWLHILVLVSLTLASIPVNDKDLQYILRAYILLSLLRILNLSMPVFFETTLYSYVFVYAPLLLPIYVLAKDQRLDLQYLGISRNIRNYEVPLALIVALLIAAGEFLIIKPGYLIPDLSFFSILKISIVMIFFVGFLEELIFRSILQRKLEELIGLDRGLILASILFGIMHSGYGTVYEIMFTMVAGFIMGYMYQKTRSLFFVTLTHGFVNIFLFGIFPHMF